MTREKGEFHPMSVTAFDEQARTWLRMAEEAKARSAGLSVQQARKPLSRDLGVTPSRVERISKGRFKSVPAWLYERIRASMIRALQEEMARLEHELAVARLCSLAPDEDEVFAAKAAVKAARSLIERVR